MAESQSAFYSEKENLAELVSHMPIGEQELFNRCGDLRIEAAFNDRVFVVYKPTGLLKNRAHREPQILTTLRVKNFQASAHNGCSCDLIDERFNQTMTVSHIPRQVFGYPVFISIPSRVTVQWDARDVGGRVWRSLSFAVLVKARNKASFYSKGNVYMETPNSFKKLYPTVTGTFIF